MGSLPLGLRSADELLPFSIISIGSEAQSLTEIMVSIGLDARAGGFNERRISRKERGRPGL